MAQVHRPGVASQEKGDLVAEEWRPQWFQNPIGKKEKYSQTLPGFWSWL